MRNKKFKCKFKYRENLLVNPLVNVLVNPLVNPLVNVLDYFEFPHLSYRNNLLFPTLPKNKRFCNHLLRDRKTTLSKFFS